MLAPLMAHLAAGPQSIPEDGHECDGKCGRRFLSEQCVDWGDDGHAQCLPDGYYRNDHSLRNNTIGRLQDVIQDKRRTERESKRTDPDPDFERDPDFEVQYNCSYLEVDCLDASAVNAEFCQECEDAGKIRNKSSKSAGKVGIMTTASSAAGAVEPQVFDPAPQWAAEE